MRDIFGSRLKLVNEALLRQSTPQRRGSVHRHSTDVALGSYGKVFTCFDKHLLDLQPNQFYVNHQKLYTMSLSDTPAVVSKNHSLKHEKWGNNCDAWCLLKQENMVIKQERMPEGAEEILHFHKVADQFFYILKGKAMFEVDGVLLIVHEGEGLQIPARKQHRIMNRDKGFLDFLVCSQPSTQNDRFDLV